MSLASGNHAPDGTSLPRGISSESDARGDRSHRPDDAARRRLPRRALAPLQTVARARCEAPTPFTTVPSRRVTANAAASPAPRAPTSPSPPRPRSSHELFTTTPVRAPRVAPLGRGVRRARRDVLPARTAGTTRAPRPSATRSASTPSRSASRPTPWGEGAPGTPTASTPSGPSGVARFATCAAMEPPLYDPTTPRRASRTRRQNSGGRPFLQSSCAWRPGCTPPPPAPSPPSAPASCAHYLDRFFDEVAGG